MTYIKPGMTTEEQIATFNEMLKLPPDMAKPLLFTPELAHHILENHNRGNRPKRTGNIALWAKKMAAGEWGLTGQTIVFSKKPFRILDGQHRLAASIAAQAPFRAFAVFGIDPINFDLIDSGARRNAADVLALMNAQDPAVMAGALKTSKALITKNAFDRSTPDNHDVRKDYEALSRSAEDLATMNRFCADARAITKDLRWNGAPLFAPGPLAGILFYTHLWDKKATAKLRDQLINRTNNGKVLANYMANILKAGGRIHDVGRTAAILTAWAAIRDGRIVKPGELKKALENAVLSTPSERTFPYAD